MPKLYRNAWQKLLLSLAIDAMAALIISFALWGMANLVAVSFGPAAWVVDMGYVPFLAALLFLFAGLSILWSIIVVVGTRFGVAPALACRWDVSLAEIDDAFADGMGRHRGFERWTSEEFRSWRAFRSLAAGCP